MALGGVECDGQTMRKFQSNGLWPSHLLGTITSTSIIRTYPETAKYIRNQLRPYSAFSIIQIALRRLDTGDYEDIHHLQTWPWLTCLIVKLTLEDDSIPLDGEECPERVFNRCLNALWEAQAGRDRLRSDQNIWLQLRAMLPAQLAFQNLPAWDFLRYPALIDRLEENHPSRMQFLERFGMQPHEFMCISYAILAGVLNGKKYLDSTYYAQLTSYFGGAVTRVFDDFSCDLVGLREKLISEKLRRQATGELVRPEHEYNEVPWLQRYPLLRKGRTEFIIWHPAVFARGFQTAVHRRMSISGAEYSSRFSQVFEDYVLELLKDSGTDFFGENDYKKLVGRDKKAVEAIISEDGVNIFIESKLTVYSEIVNVSSEQARVWIGVKRLYEAMRQGWAVSSILQKGVHDKGKWGQATENYLLIVTSQPMGCASGDQFRRLFGRDVFDAERVHNARQTVPSPEQLQLLPPEHIVIASIDEYEHLMSAVKRGELHLPTMFREIAKQIIEPKTSFMYLEQFLGKKYAGTNGAPVVLSALDAMHETLAKCFDVDPSFFQK